MMRFYGGFLPKEPKPGKTGYYPVTNAKESTTPTIHHKWMGLAGGAVPFL